MTGNLPERKDGSRVAAERSETAGAKPMAAALRTGFHILRVLAVLLGIFFLLSNIYWVPEGKVAVHCRLGELLGSDSGSAVRPPGGPYFAFPYPIDQIVQYPTSLQQVAVDTAFWLEGDDTGSSDSAALQGASLRPGIHGSLITGDQNLVQGKWIVRYRLDYSARLPGADRQVVAFASTIGSRAGADEIVRLLTEEAIVATTAGTPVVDFVAGRMDHERLLSAVQAKADALGAGLKITAVTASTYQPPFALAADFQAVNQAESEKARQIEKAVRYRVSTLSEIAGEHWEALLELLNADLSAEPHGRSRDQAIRALQRLMLSGELGGEVAQILDRARIDKTRTIELARGRADRFRELLGAYRRDRAVLKEQLLIEVLRHLFADPASAVHFVPPEARIYLNTDTSDNP